MEEGIDKFLLGNPIYIKFYNEYPSFNLLAFSIKCYYICFQKLLIIFMINVLDKHYCCGCSACVQACPNKCIVFNEDIHGFSYPKVDLKSCINCGLCEKVCPVIQQGESRLPLGVYAAKSTSESLRIKSSSGGLFTMIAENIINEGGVVFGAEFDENWEVRHSYTESKEGLLSFQGSKYVQSLIGDSFIKVKSFLEDGRKVLFTGTACQISGLKKFLRKEYLNLFTIDVVCHGVPSPLVWRSYKEFVRKKCSINDITNITFRSKTTGWKKYSVVITGNTAQGDKKVILSETVDKNIYMQLFLNDLCLRPSCSNCPAKCGKSGSDITLADFWGIENINPEFDDNKGVSLIMLNTLAGFNLLDRLDVLKLESTYELAIRYNPSIEQSSVENKYVKIFWDKFITGGIDASKVVLRYFKISLLRRIARRIKNMIIH